MSLKSWQRVPYTAHFQAGPKKQTQRRRAPVRAIQGLKRWGEGLAASPSSLVETIFELWVLTSHKLSRLRPAGVRRKQKSRLKGWLSTDDAGKKPSHGWIPNRSRPSEQCHSHPLCCSPSTLSSIDQTHCVPVTLVSPSPSHRMSLFLPSGDPLRHDMSTVPNTSAPNTLHHARRRQARFLTSTSI